MADKTFTLQIISPTRIFFDEEVDMVEMRTTEGEIGVLAGHIPLTAIVEPGVVRIHQEGKVREAALLDGFVEIRGNKVTVLAEACEWPDEIDVHRAEEAKLRAERRIGSGEKQVDMVRAELALKKALTRINLVSTLGK